MQCRLLSSGGVPWDSNFRPGNLTCYLVVLHGTPTWECDRTDFVKIYTVCPTRYQTRHFFNNSTFEQEYVRCVRNEEECVVVHLIFATRSSGPPASQPVIKEMPCSVASGTPYI
jgi:hypothetical protein